MIPSCIQKVWRRFQNKVVRVLLVGLDSAGKTTTLYQLKLGEVVLTAPTDGFNRELVRYNGISFACCDLGGKKENRHLWRHYFQFVQALVFVVDSNDRDRLDAARYELLRLMTEKELQDAVVLVLANKQDLPNAMSGPELVDGLRLRNSSHPWHLQPTNALTGEGLHEGLAWLISATIEGHPITTTPKEAKPLPSKKLSNTKTQKGKEEGRLSEPLL